VYASVYRVRVFENGNSGPKRDGVTQRWRKQENKELHNLYSSPNIILSNEGGLDGQDKQNSRDENLIHRFCCKARREGHSQA
jgi:hypothetical protein